MVNDYIFVEGSSDKIYLESYLSKYIRSKNLRIIPIGGARDVINIVKNIHLVITESEAKIKGKALGIIDTDEQLVKIENFKDSSNVKLKRIQYDKNKKDIQLINVDANPASPATDIEDTLEPEHFIDTIKQFIDKNNADYSFIFTKDIDIKAKCSYNVIDYTESQRDKIREFFKIDQNKRKVEFANKYIQHRIDGSKISLVQEIIRLFGWEI